MRRLKHILRWLAVLPGAILAAIIVMFPVHWAAILIHHFGGFSDPIITNEEGKGLLQSMPLESLERFGDALFVPGTSIGIGALTAPRFRFVTAIVIASLLIGFLSWAIAQAMSMGMHSVDSPFRMVLTALLWLVSMGSALSFARYLDKATSS
jgi:hypothetical protein